MKIRALRSIISIVVGAAALVVSGTALSADQFSTNLTDSVVVKRAVAANIESDRAVRNGFRWNRNEVATTSESTVAARASNKPDVIWHSLSTAPSSRTADVNVETSEVYAVKGFRWGVKGAAEQQGFRWGVKSTVEQQGFRWGVKNAAEQQGFRWGVKNAAEQQGFRWGVKNAAEQQGFRWGVKNAAEQQGFRWGVKNASTQQGFRWGVKSVASQQGFRWGVK